MTNRLKMAAATPRKFVNKKQCIFCAGGEKRLSCFANNKVLKSKTRGVAEWVAGRELRSVESSLYICNACLNFASKWIFTGEF